MSLNPTPPATAGGNGLLGCPFCGSEAELIEGKWSVDIVCKSAFWKTWGDPDKCKMAPKISYSANDGKPERVRPLAIAAWNRRALPPMGNVVAWSVRPLDYHSTILIGDEPAGDVSPQLAQLLADRHNSTVATLTQALTDLRREVEAERAEVGHLRTESERRRLAIQLLQETIDEAAAELAQLRADAKAMAESLLWLEHEGFIEIPKSRAICLKHAPLPAPQQVEGNEP